MKGFIKRTKRSKLKPARFCGEQRGAGEIIHPGINCIFRCISVKYVLPAKKRWESQMPETEIKQLMKHLGESINETLAESPKINERIKEIRDAGYEVFLVIEAKVGFSRKGKADGEIASSSPEEPVRLRITSEDAKFLKSLKISVEDN
jgi:hypothetical protein